MTKPGGRAEPKEHMMKRPLHLLLLVSALIAAALTVTDVGLAAPVGTTGGTLTFCTDATYPPEEFFQGSKVVGSDIDIGTAVAKGSV